MAGGSVCDACWRSVHAFAAPDREPGPHATGTVDVGDAQAGRAGTAIDFAAAVGEYDGTLREIIHALKYGRRRSIARRLGRLMREQGAGLLAGSDVAVPVPLHPARRRSRGFNQASLLARELGRPVVEALRRTRHTRRQVDMRAEARLLNVSGAFALRRRDRWKMRWRGRPHPLAGLTVVLVDDVCTTGATLEACARELKAAGAVSVGALTAARVSTRPR